MDVTASRAFQAGVRTGASVDTNLAATFSLQLTKKGRLISDYTRNDALRRSGDEQLSVAYATRFEYKLQRHVALTFGFTHTTRESDVRIDNFTLNEAKAGFRLTW